jgi:hypothetical protein
MLPGVILLLSRAARLRVRYKRGNGQNKDSLPVDEICAAVHN